MAAMLRFKLRMWTHEQRGYHQPEDEELSIGLPNEELEHIAPLMPQAI